MLLNWFDTEEAVGFAAKMAKDINSLFPPADQKVKAISRKSFEKKLESMIARTRVFAFDYNFNVYKKAKFLNTIKWELHEAGHEDDFINDVILLITPLLESK